jgi:AraC-like DNA-binding protein
MAGFSDRHRTPLPLRLIPHPAVTLGLVFGTGSLAVDDAAGRVHTGSLVAGLGLGFGAVRLRRVEDFACLQVRLPPVVAGAVLGVRPSELDGGVVPLDDLWGHEAGLIAERMSEAGSWEERFAWVDAMLARRAGLARRGMIARSNGGGPLVDPEVAWAWHQMVASQGLVRIDHLAAELGWSRKRLWSRFHAQIGLPPKRAAKLVRFDHAAHRLVAGQNAARVAADGGYTDQSHLHRDVMAFAGVTPANVAAEPFLTIDDIAWPTRGTPAAAAQYGRSSGRQSR